jgi:hypothetical protein
MADIVIINPRFDISFWGMEHCIGLLGKRANLPVACLALLAALVPDHHDVTLIDENVEDIDFARVARADLVCLTRPGRNSYTTGIWAALRAATSSRRRPM